MSPACSAQQLASAHGQAQEVYLQTQTSPQFAVDAAEDHGGAHGGDAAA